MKRVSWIEIAAGTAFGIGVAFIYLAAKGWIWL